MSVKVFVLGRPGSGKTTAVRRMMELAKERGWNTRRIKDYKILHSMFLADSEHKKFLPAAHGGFDVIDFSVLDTALEKLEKAVEEQKSQSSSEDDLIIIEFARNDYREAFKRFNPEFLQDAFFLFIEADLETCIKRVNKRVAHRATADDHFVSGEIIRGYYQEQIMLPNLKNRCFQTARLSVVGIIMLLTGQLASLFVQQVLHHPVADISIILAPAVIGLAGITIFILRIAEYVGMIRLSIISFIVLTSDFSLLFGSPWLILHLDPFQAVQSPLLLWTMFTLVFLLGIVTACASISIQITLQEHTLESLPWRGFSLQFKRYSVGSIALLLFVWLSVHFIGLEGCIFLVSLSMLFICWWEAKQERVKVINNSRSQQHFEKKVNRFANFIFENEAPHLVGRDAWWDFTKKLNQSVNDNNQKEDHKPSLVG